MYRVVVLLVKGYFGYFGIEKQDLAMWLGKGSGAGSALLKNQLIF